MLGYKCVINESLFAVHGAETRIVLNYNLGFSQESYGLSVVLRPPIFMCHSTDTGGPLRRNSKHHF